MRVGSRLILALAASLLAGCTRGPATATERRIAAVERGLLSEYGDPFWRRMDLKDRMAHYRVPGVSIAVIEDYGVAWAQGYGVLESGGHDRVTPDTLFQAASLGKPVVAVAALHYVEEGALDMDGDANQRLISWRVPENAYTAEEKVTLRRLLSHTAGITVEGFRGYARGEATPDLLQILDGEPPANSPPIRVDLVPGTLHRYSGGGYMIVQQLLEDVGGEPFPDLMRHTVLEPWGMRVSTFASPLPDGLLPSAASGHRADGSPIPGGWHTYPEMGSGASLWSTPSDMARFAVGVMQAYTGHGDGVLSSSMAAEMLTPITENRGLGPLVYDDGGDRVYFMHPGANDGYKAVLVAYPLRGQGVVIMTNSDSGDALWREILNGVSVEYGWVRNNTLLYILTTVALGLALWRLRAVPKLLVGPATERSAPRKSREGAR